MLDREMVHHPRRFIAHLVAVSTIAVVLATIPAGVAMADTPATEPDEVGMVDGIVRAVEVAGDRIWVGGAFTKMRDANGIAVATASGLAAFDADSGAPLTSIDLPQFTRTAGPPIVYDLSYGTNGLLYVAGLFDRADGLARHNVAAIDPDDGSVAAFSPGTTPARSILATPGAIYVGTKRLLSFQPSGAPTPGYTAPEVETDPTLRGHETPPQVRDLVLAGSSLIAACQCDSTLEGGVSTPSKAVIKVDASTGAVQPWRPANLSNSSAAFGISVTVANDPGSGKPTVYVGAGGSDFVGGFDLATGQQIIKNDTSGSAQAVAWMDGLLYVGGHFQWVAKAQGQQCDANDHPNTECHHAPRLVVVDPDTGRVIPQDEPWNPGICCKYNGIWAITPDLARGRLHLGGEFTKVGGHWEGSGTDWTLVGARTQAYYARLSGTPTTLETLGISFSGDGAGRVVSDPPGADCTDDCEAGFAEGTVVTLTAEADTGSTFAGWSGACSGTGSCTVTMTQARAVTATFDADEPTPTTCGRIAYSSARRGNVDVFTMSKKGTQPDRVTNGDARDRDAAWSPDCSQLAYASDRSGDAEIYVIDVDGSDRRRLTNAEGADTQPTWSPDGTRIAFTSTRTGNAEVFVMDADGSDETNLTRHAARDRAADWSPDGGRIAFDSDRGDDVNVWTMTTTGGNARKLTGDQGRSTSPAYAPDGDTIAFVSDRGGSKQLWLMDTDGGRSRQLTDDGGAHSSPTWSPSGKRIASSSTRTGHSQIWVIRPNGSHARNLSKSEHADTSPSWS